jgi:PHD/YefM family antitoxin component YafN of YafNO toxin-antitoxin module
MLLYFIDLLNYIIYTVIMLNPMPKKVISVSDFQRKTKPTFDAILNSEEPVLVMNRSRQVGVFLNPRVYNKFVEMYEDYIDSKDLAKAVHDSYDTFYTLDEVAEEIKGVLIKLFLKKELQSL